MLAENKFSKYFLYAVGEIVLVVIGILIALQINDWKQISEDSTEELKLLSAFQEEFSQNKENVIKIKTHYSEITKTNKHLMELIGKNPSHINKLNLDEGQLVVEGKIQSLDYADHEEERTKSGVFGKMFR